MLNKIKTVLSDEKGVSLIEFGLWLTIPRRESPPFQGWDERRASWLRLLDMVQGTNICSIIKP